MKTTTTTTTPIRPHPSVWNFAAALLLGALALSGCGKSGESPSASSPATSGAKVTIQNKGSDTLVNVAQMWSEEYKKAAPSVNVEVSGGGSGTGISALIAGTIDIANASRNMKESEIAEAKTKTGKTPKETVIGYDGLAIYVNKNNPLNEITIEQLAAIFAEGGTNANWSQIGVKIPGADKDEIVRVGRQSSSGTFDFFKEHVMANKDFKQGTHEMNGSKDVVELIGGTLTAIGYSGMGYATPEVKILKVSEKPGQPAMEPTPAHVLDKSYAISRSLMVYTLGEPAGEVKKYIDWILSDAGQAVLEKGGYVPLPPAQRTK